jgi:hypothetical protein
MASRLNPSGRNNETPSPSCPEKPVAVFLKGFTSGSANAFGADKRGESIVTIEKKTKGKKFIGGRTVNRLLIGYSARVPLILPEVLHCAAIAALNSSRKASRPEVPV